MEKSINQAEEGREFAEMLKDLSGADKAQVKGIIIGMKMAQEAKQSEPDKRTDQSA